MDNIAILLFKNLNIVFNIQLFQPHSPCPGFFTFSHSHVKKITFQVIEF